MSELISSLRQLLHEQLERRRQRGFLEAAMAACALVAAADGRVSLGERSRVDLILESLEGLSLFDPHEGVEAFNRYLQQLEDNPEDGREQVLAALRDQIEDDPAQGPLLVRLCQAIGAADGAPGPDQREAIAGLCSELGLEPKREPPPG